MTSAAEPRVTLGEIGRRFDEFRADYKDSIAGLHRRLDELNVLHVDVYEADKKTALEQRSALASRVKALEDARKADRTMVLVGLVFPILVLIFGAILYTAIGGHP